MNIIEPLVRSGLILLVIGFASLCLYDSVMNLSRDRMTTSGPYTPNAQDMFRYIAENTHEQDIIIFFKPRALRMLTNRPAIQVDFPSEIKRGDYLCLYLGPDAYQQISPQQVNDLVIAGSLEFVYSNEQFILYRVIKPDL